MKKESSPKTGKGIFEQMNQTNQIQYNAFTVEDIEKLLTELQDEKGKTKDLTEQKKQEIGKYARRKLS